MSDSSAEDVVVDSATSQDQPVAASADTAVTDASAASSTAEAKPAETTFDRVKAIVTKSETSPTSKEPEPAAKADPDSTAQTEDPGKVSPEEMATWHAKTRDRFTKLTSKLGVKDTEIASLAPKAAEFDKIDTFIKNAGLSPQDVGSTLQIAAMLRSEPAKARERLLPIMAELDRILGETLPDDLQARVNAGYLTEEDARAVARSAADAKLARAQATRLTEQQTQENEARQTQQTIDSTVSAVETWEKQKAVSDPDWHTKRVEVADEVELAIQRKARELQNPNYFPNATESVKFSEEALKKVEGRRKQFGPKLKAIDPPVGQGASPRSVAQPKNTLDIVRRIASGGA